MTTTHEVATMPQQGVAVPQQTSASTVSQAVHLTPGPVWGSWEQFRIAGSRGLSESLPLGSVGRLRTKHGEFACLRWSDFDRIYGLSRDVHRLSQGVMLMHQAAEVVLRSEDLDLGVKMIRDLTLQYQLPAVGQTPLPELNVDPEDEGDEGLPSIDTFSPPRPEWR